MSLKLNHVLVAVDVADDEARALAQVAVNAAQDLAAPAGASLRIVTVLPLPPNDPVHTPSQGGVESSNLSTAQKHAARHQTAVMSVEALARGADCPAEGVVLLGEDVPGTLVSEAARTGADLVVVSSHGRQGLKRLVLGSVAEGVARRAPAPVLLIRPEAAR